MFQLYVFIATNIKNILYLDFKTNFVPYLYTSQVQYKILFQMSTDFSVVDDTAMWTLILSLFTTLLYFLSGKLKVHHYIERDLRLSVSIMNILRVVCLLLLHSLLSMASIFEPLKQLLDSSCATVLIVQHGGHDMVKVSKRKTYNSSSFSYFLLQTILTGDKIEKNTAANLLLNDASHTMSKLNTMRSTWSCFDVIDLADKKVVCIYFNAKHIIYCLLIIILIIIYYRPVIAYFLIF